MRKGSHSATALNKNGSRSADAARTQKPDATHSKGKHANANLVNIICLDHKKQKGIMHESRDLNGTTLVELHCLSVCQSLPACRTFVCLMRLLRQQQMPQECSQKLQLCSYVPRRSALPEKERKREGGKQGAFSEELHQAPGARRRKG